MPGWLGSLGAIANTNACLLRWFFQVEPFYHDGFLRHFTCAPWYMAFDFDKRSPPQQFKAAICKVCKDTLQPYH